MPAPAMQIRDRQCLWIMLVAGGCLFAFGHLFQGLLLAAWSVLRMPVKILVPLASAAHAGAAAVGTRSHCDCIADPTRPPHTCTHAARMHAQTKRNEVRVLGSWRISSPNLRSLTLQTTQELYVFTAAGESQTDIALAPAYDKKYELSCVHSRIPGHDLLHKRPNLIFAVSSHTEIKYAVLHAILTCWWEDRQGKRHLASHSVCCITLCMHL